MEDINAQAIRDNVVSLDDIDADGVDECHAGESDPTAKNVRRRLVQDVLVPLGNGEAPFRNSGGGGRRR